MRWKTRVSKTRSCFAFILSGLTRTTECETSNFLYHITPKSNIKVTREKGSDHHLRVAIDCSTNSPWEHLREFIENSMENIHAEVRFSFASEWLSDAVWGRHSPRKLRVQRLNKKAAACLRVTIMNMFKQCVNHTASKQPITWLKWPLLVPEKDSTRRGLRS